MKSKIVIMALLSVISVSSFAESHVTIFESCYHEKSKNIPSAAEKHFLDAYLTYLKTGKKNDGTIAIEKMKELAKSQGGKFSTKWAGIFEGAIELCCGGPQTCTESFGSISLSVLMPRVEKGWVTAINLVLTYEQLAKVDGAEAEGLQDYLEVIRQKHSWSIRMFKNKI